MVVHEVDQRESDWFKLRIGKVTASELNNLLTPEFKPRVGEMKFSYLCAKLAELWTGGPLPSQGGSWATEQGQIREDEAWAWVSLEKEWNTKKVGFIETDDHKAGCSPDGLIDDTTGLELKCPQPHTHCKYLVNGTLPKEYATQVHCSMFVTGFPKWVFCSYLRNFPALIIEVERDEEIIEKIRTAVDEFHEQLEEAKEKLSKYE